MPKSTDIVLKNIALQTEQISFRAPLKFGGRVVTDCVLVNVAADVETRDGRRGSGFGSMPMGNVWAWPGQTVTVDQSLAAMLEFCRRTVAAANAYRECGHPLDITHDLLHEHNSMAAEACRSVAIPDAMPRLA